MQSYIYNNSKIEFRKLASYPRPGFWLKGFHLRPVEVRRVVLLIALCCLGLAGPAEADAPQPDAQSSSECDNAQTTAAMRACENARYERADHEMNAVYQTLLSMLDKPGQAKLRRAQQAWTKFRDAEADFQSDTARGGTLALLIRTSVLADLTASRTDQLSKQVQERKK
jgi:uncharacterized protein YecT (DUF1311 family)